ncbi:MAG: hypothetical protein RR311_01120 [Comamonas sp.]
MRIADEIDYVLREFVSCEGLFHALMEEQKLELYQIASWMTRNEDQLLDIRMVECNHARRDFRVLEDDWISDVLSNIRMNDNPGWSGDVSPGFIAGWLKSELKDFFKATEVDFPEKSLASPRGNFISTIPLPVSSFSSQETREDSGEVEKVVGTRERTTLLTVIAALAEAAKISLVTPSKSAEIIAGMTERMGTPVAKRTIEEHLKKVPDALDRKSR